MYRIHDRKSFEIQTGKATVIHKLKHQFARHGIPEILISDNATQYTSEEFAQFASEWKFQHTRSAPGNKKANGAAEAAVKVIKNMMINCRKSTRTPTLEFSTCEIHQLKVLQLHQPSVSWADAQKPSSLPLTMLSRDLLKFPSVTNLRWTLKS
ncbi:endogenous retrovirus group k member 6 pol protein [Plakobranchus ocellatus]|uniref:Endogenous retrovirus group k member 6 pol protein n=1 Tax=Plakobranchus ocellatus TaxID=259542 RepID=A0AAV4DXU9_9GAST|nr:endogenous retrovirus group k member 6 pol protein [Plakobranchus ocellatus]